MVRFTQEMLIAGGGIGGMAAALACTRAGWRARVFEAAPTFEEIGAGVQLGPNATRLLRAWGLAEALAEVAFTPEHLSVRSADSGRELACARLGTSIEQRYGAPYRCVHRADLHRLLHTAVAGEAEAVVSTARRAADVSLAGDAVQLRLVDGASRAGPPVKAGELRAAGASAAASFDVEGDALLGADGLWSRIRSDVLVHDVVPRATGHRAFRCLVRQASLPLALRVPDVCVWLGSGMHAVSYPVRGGEWTNLVVLVEAARARPLWQPGEADAWNLRDTSGLLDEALRGACTTLRDLAGAAGEWRSWELFDRAPLTSPAQMASGRIALLGDAAHPMLPYLAQGAAMALEDADALGRALAMDAGSVVQRLGHYAQSRWQRAARVQQRSRRNAQIFHATGAVRWGRDLALAALGPQLLDVPWLYAGS